MTGSVLNLMCAQFSNIECRSEILLKSSTGQQIMVYSNLTNLPLVTSNLRPARIASETNLSFRKGIQADNILPAITGAVLVQTGKTFVFLFF